MQIKKMPPPKFDVIIQKCLLDAPRMPTMQKPQLLYFFMGFSSIWHVYVLTISGHFCGGVPALWMNCAEIVFAVAQPLGKLLIG